MHMIDPLKYGERNVFAMGMASIVGLAMYDNLAQAQGAETVGQKWSFHQRGMASFKIGTSLRSLCRFCVMRHIKMVILLAGAMISLHGTTAIPNRR